VNEHDRNRLTSLRPHEFLALALIGVVMVMLYKIPWPTATPILAFVAVSIAACGFCAYLLIRNARRQLLRPLDILLLTAVTLTYAALGFLYAYKLAQILAFAGWASQGQ
jgi:hypothetical protein